MSAAPVPSTTDQQPDSGAFNLDFSVAKRFLAFAGGFWRGETATSAWTLTAGLAVTLILSTYATVQLNHWNRWFFDALERRDIPTVKSAIAIFLLIIAGMAAIGVAVVITRETLQVRWRAWLVEHLLAMWLDDARYYKMNVSGTEPPNPEYRISDDTRWATEMLVDMGIGLVLALFGGIAFIAILWTAGGDITVAGVTIPGYMVWVALCYGIFASSLMAWIGRPLVGRVGQKNEAEGYFRFAMMRLRDNAESVAIMRGGAAEKAILGTFYKSVVGRWLNIVRSHGHLTWVTNATGPMIPIVPLFFAAPKYLAGDLTLGQVTQLAAAFIQVQIAISWVVDNYNRIAEWYASARRVMDIVIACEAVDAIAIAAPIAPLAPSGSTIAPAITLSAITLADGEGRTLLAPLDLTLAAGTAVHIKGASSTGKSTLARVLAGLSRPASGTIARAPKTDIALVPQRAYMPLGTLSASLAYPAPETAKTATEYVAALTAVGLAALTPRLDETQRWDQVLSVGERQRLAIARLLLRRPAIIVLDDALSALDDDAQSKILTTLRKSLPDAALMSFAQRAAPATSFDQHYRLAPVSTHDITHTLVADETAQTLSHTNQQAHTNIKRGATIA